MTSRTKSDAVIRRWIIAAALALPIGSATAKLAQPDFVFYGTATWFGEALADGTEITLRLTSQGLTIAGYRLGDESPLGGLYALRVPMDAIDPQARGSARPGDPATIHISGSLVAEVLIGDYGEAERLDIDPAFLSGDSLSLAILGGSVVETDIGTVPLDYTIDLSNSAPADVQVNWATEDGSAQGGASCTAGVDYLSDAGVATIPTGQDQVTIQVQVCGDFLIESTEDVLVRLSNPVNAVIQSAVASGQILDEDGQPELSVRDLVAFEPSSGSQVGNFEVRLSRSHDQDVGFDYQTSDGTAVAGSDYSSASGNLVIPAGQTKALIPVSVSGDGTPEGPETFFLDISNASEAVIIDAQGMAIILDADSVRETDLALELDNTGPGLEGLISPTDLVFSPDGAHAYVSALVTGSILRFNLGSSGALSVQQNIDEATAGFAAGLFDGIRQMAMTPDGRFLYAASSGGNGVMGMARDPSDGTLSFLESLTSDAGSGLSGLEGATGIAISGDGAHLYVTGRTANTLAVLAIDSADGTLSAVETEAHGADDPADGGGTVSRMDGPMRVVVSPDGNNVYVAADRSSGVVVFDRNAATGAVSFRISYQNTIDGVAGIGGASALAMPSDGTQLYVLGGATDSIARFNLLGDGSLSFGESYAQSNGDFVGLKNPVELFFNSAGSKLYAVGIDDSSLLTMNRETDGSSANFGNLSFGDVAMDDSDAVTQMAGPTSVTVSPDDQIVVVTAGVDNALVVFQGTIIFANGFEIP